MQFTHYELYVKDMVERPGELGDLFAQSSCAYSQLIHAAEVVFSDILGANGQTGDLVMETLMYYIRSTPSADFTSEHFCQFATSLWSDQITPKQAQGMLEVCVEEGIIGCSHDIKFDRMRYQFPSPIRDNLLQLVRMA